MKYFLLQILFSLLFLKTGHAQPVKYRLAVRDLFGSTDSVFSIPEREPAGAAFDAETDDGTMLAEQTASVLREIAYRHALEYSKVLRQLAAISLDTWKNSHFSERKKMRRIRKALSRTMHHVRSRFGILEVYSFSVPLLDDNKQRFFYDRHGTAGGLNLYKGRKEDRREEDYEYVPLDPLTDSAIRERILHELKRRGISRDLHRGIYSYVGVCVQTDRRTLYKRKIPQARIVIFLGAKRLQGIRKP